MRIILVLAALLAVSPVQALPNQHQTEDPIDLRGEQTLMARVSEVTQRVEVGTSELVQHALSFLGVPYRRGGSSEPSGFDCSGFVRSVVEQTVGLVLPRRAAQQAKAAEKVDRTQLQPGDLVFFNTMRRAFSHVGIYIGNNQFVHAPKPGARVRVDNLNQTYWARRFDGARRVATEPDGS